MTYLQGVVIIGTIKEILINLNWTKWLKCSSLTFSKWICVFKVKIFLQSLEYPFTNQSCYCSIQSKYLNNSFKYELISVVFRIHPLSFRVLINNNLVVVKTNSSYVISTSVRFLEISSTKKIYVFTGYKYISFKSTV